MTKRCICLTVTAAVVISISATAANAQIDQMCRDFSHTAMFGKSRTNAGKVYGQIRFRGLGAGAKRPRATVTFMDPGGLPRRLTVARNGNYCFSLGQGGGTLIVEVDGSEVDRRSVAAFPAQLHREDFDVILRSPKTSPPAVISSKFYRPPNRKTLKLYKKAAKAEAAVNFRAVRRHLKAIVASDPEDFIAWNLLAGFQLRNRDLKNAESSVRKAIDLRADYTPAWINAGRVRGAQKQYEAAIEAFLHAGKLEPDNAAAFHLLGESYLRNGQGNLAVEALNRAIRLEPERMAGIHLILARVYQLAEMPQMASKEYETFLAKRPEHPDKAKFIKFIAANPE